MKNKLSFATTVISLFVFSAVIPQSTFAVSNTDFGSCLNPKVTASQVNAGDNHGVVGQSKPYSGTDTIYTLQDGNVLQCLCTVEGAGIETKWMKAINIPQEELSVYQSQGWIYVPTGTAWGLDDDPYLAKNSDFSCKGSEQSTSSSSNNGSSNSTSVTAETGVLGLASTGTTLPVYGFILAGLLSLFTGIFLSRSKK